jgi:hypothetical protein
MKHSKTRPKHSIEQSMTTPSYIKTAVNAYYEKGDRSHLRRMFEQGIPLHCYSESRDLISKLIEGEKPRKKSLLNSASEIEKRFYIAMFVAELKGAGFALTANGIKPDQLTAIDIASLIYNMDESTVRKTCWYPLKNDPRIKEQKRIGKQNEKLVRELFTYFWVNQKVEN